MGAHHPLPTRPGHRGTGGPQVLAEQVPAQGGLSRGCAAVRGAGRGLQGGPQRHDPHGTVGAAPASGSGAEVAQGGGKGRRSKRGPLRRTRSRGAFLQVPARSCFCSAASPPPPQGLPVLDTPPRGSQRLSSLVRATHLCELFVFQCKWSRKGFVRTRWSVADWYVGCADLSPSPCCDPFCSQGHQALHTENPAACPAVIGARVTQGPCHRAALWPGAPVAPASPLCTTDLFPSVQRPALLPSPAH